MKTRVLRLCPASCLCAVSTASQGCGGTAPLMPHAVAHRNWRRPIPASTAKFNVALEGYTEPRLTAGPRPIPRDSLARDWHSHHAGRARSPRQLHHQYHRRQQARAATWRGRVLSPEGLAHRGATDSRQSARQSCTACRPFCNWSTSRPGLCRPAVTIDDEPRFPWRGLMIDSGRHFHARSTSSSATLDGMEAVKLNVFHWHLSDDQGFRVESKTYPLLHEKGSERPLLHAGSKLPRCHRSTPAIAASASFPSSTCPCHTTSWFVGYPQLASGQGPYKIADHWGVFDSAMDPTRESTFQFLDKFIGEMTALFPDAYFHVGGDECNGKEWNANPKIQAYMRAHGLKDNAALQSYFTGRVQKLVAAHHKIMEGWDEVLQPDTPKDVVIQSWRGPKALAAAARQGNRGAPFQRLLHRSQPVRGLPLPERSAGRRRRLPHSGRKGAHPRRRSHHVERVRAPRRTSTAASGRAPPPSPSASGRRRIFAMWTPCTRGSRWCRGTSSSTGCIINPSRISCCSA